MTVRFLVQPHDRIRLTGRDRDNWLHNFCTADIKNLKVGNSTEAMILDSRGKVLGWVLAIANQDSIELITASGTASGLIQHLDRYVIREDVRFENASGTVVGLMIFGDELAEWTKTHLGHDMARNCCGVENLNGQAVQVCQTSYFGPSLWVSLAMEYLHSGWLSGIDAGEATIEEFDFFRIQNGCPAWNIDVDSSYLPQEFCRDELAISFTKGCYLGQETVARIDALGHVNRKLAVLQFQVPAASLLPPLELQDESGQNIGTCTSCATDPDNPTNVWAIGTLKRMFARPGQKLHCGEFIGVVVEPNSLNR